MQMEASETEHPRYGRCARLSNGIVELFVSLDFGPRVLHFSLVGGDNILFFNTDPAYFRSGPEFDAVFGPGSRWFAYGGNRTWAAPHSFPHAFYPDNDPVGFRFLEDGAVFTPPPRKVVDLQIQLEIRLEAGISRTRLAVWSIACLDAGGRAILPWPNAQTGDLPNWHLSLWPYTDASDSRIGIGSRYLSLRQDPGSAAPLKLGIAAEDGKAFYLKDNLRFELAFKHQSGAEYPDFGVSCEMYTDAKMLELESLSPLSIVERGGTMAHEEVWNLTKGPLTAEPGSLFSDLGKTP
ncbi:MAG: hypothetical protein NT061_11165 [Spirochaetes bacterium]|nr:hypothetical protein [Spirochaetota bacterium]